MSRLAHFQVAPEDGPRLQAWVAGLAPHRCRQFKLSTDPHFALKAREVIGLYMDPPRTP